MKAPRREFKIGDKVPPDTFFPVISCGHCRQSFAAFGQDLAGEVRCACGALLGEFRNGIRVR